MKHLLNVCLIYEVKCSLFEYMYIDNTQKTFKKITDSHLSNVQHLLKNGQKSDSLAAQYGQHHKYGIPRMDLRKCITFKVVKKFNPIGSLKSFMKPNFNLCIEEHLTILKRLRDKFPYS